MKLAKVQHYRCNQYDATTYVWIPNEMNDSDLAHYCELAYAAYWKAEETFERSPEQPKYPGYGPQYQKYPEKTVDEVAAIFKKETATYEAWKTKVNAARKSFGQHLENVSNNTIRTFWNVRSEELGLVEADVDWGHKHGRKCLYEDTNLGKDEIYGSQHKPKDQEED